MLFQIPPATRFDLQFSLFGIPIRVHPLFWLIALLLGSSGSPLQIVIWVLVVFVSVVVHELGHALAFRNYGQRSYIVLHMGGGLTIPETSSWGGGLVNTGPSPMQQIIISLAGPFAGFLFAAVIIAGIVLSGGAVALTWLFGFIPLPLSPILPVSNVVLSILVATLLWVNIFWGLINLLPVFPLDGGQVARNALIQYDPLDGARKSLWLSVIAGGLMAVVGLLVWHSVYMALLFAVLAFESYQQLSSRFGAF